MPSSTFSGVYCSIPLALFGTSGIFEGAGRELFILAVLLLLFGLVVGVFLARLLEEKRAKKIRVSQVLYENLFQQAPIGIILTVSSRDDVSPELDLFNPAALEILARSEADLVGIDWQDLTHPEDLELESEYYERFSKGELPSYSFEKRLIRPDGSLVWVNAKIASLSRKGWDGETFYFCLLEDITHRKTTEEALRESERSKAVLLNHIPGMAFRARNDQDRTLEYASAGCLSLTGYASESLLYNRDISFNEIISAEYRQLIQDEWVRVLEQNRHFRAEYEIITRSGERKWVLELGQAVLDEDGGLEALEGIIFDISDQKKREASVTYLRERDFLTGLYNRPYLEKQQKRLQASGYMPLSVLLCDINGLRMINDAYGQSEGDHLIVETARLLATWGRPQDIIGRVSGGEFLVLLPKTHQQAILQLSVKLKELIQSYNRNRKDMLYEMSLSIAYSTQRWEKEQIDAVIRRATEHLNHRKLLDQKSTHHAIVRSMLATLYANSQETEEHGRRIAQLATMIGKRLNLEEEALDDLELLSMLHDIGKIGISDRILNKPGKLTPEEWVQMKKHTEIGYRIAAATPQLEHIAPYILYHHERWDGSGYPQGLSGFEIPLLSRVLAVADAYDAMIEERVYSKAKSSEAALAEIQRCSGTQFDPQVARLFLEIMKEDLDQIG